MITIRDYELIHNVDVLFEKPIIILGIGNYGKKIYELIKGIPIEVSYIYDRKLNCETYMGVPVVSWFEIEKISREQEYLIIIASETYQYEFIEELNDRRINGYFCTWFGVQVTIELNIRKDVFSQEYRHNYLNKRDVLIHTKRVALLYENLHALASCEGSILIYQPEKVGSTSVWNALQKAKVSSVHLHYLFHNIEEYYKLTNGFDGICEGFFKQIVQTIMNREEVKIITLVRDPIARALSLFMQRFWRSCVTIECDENIGKVADDFVHEQLESNFEFIWFDKEIKALTGINIYEYPFDKEKGYGIIEKDNVKILIIKMENLDDNISKIEEFVGISSIELLKENVGENKYYKYIYEGIKKNFVISKSMLESQYIHNQYLNHFYTDEEKDGFFRKWEKKDGGV